MEKLKKYIVEVEKNLLNDGTIWIIYKTIFNSKTKLFLVVNLKTLAILGYIIYQDTLNEDLIIELYQKVLDCYHSDHNQSVSIIHSDSDFIFSSKKIKKFLDREKIEIYSQKGSKNQLFQSINERIQALVTRILVEKDSRPLREWRKSIPKELKNLPLNNRIKNHKYQTCLFESDLFRKKGFQTIVDAIAEYNKYNTKSYYGYKDSYNNGYKDGYNNGYNSKKLSPLQYHKLKDYSLVRKQNRDFKDQIILLEVCIMYLMYFAKKFEAQFEQERLKKEMGDRRKRATKREPITESIYKFLIQESKKTDSKSRFRAARLRLALCLLLVTGVRISELLPLQIKQVRVLFVESFIAIDRAKRQAFLTNEGTRVVRERLPDLEMISLIKQNDDDSFIFASETVNRPLKRESFTRLINKFIRDSMDKYEGKPNVTSHSFRKGFINKLWCDTNDIEFVRQAIRSTYVKELFEEKREKIKVFVS